MAKQFNIYTWKRSRETINENDKETINEDGGTYSLTISVYDSGDKVVVDMEDSEEWKEHKIFNTTKEAANHIIEYVGLWE